LPPFTSKAPVKGMLAILLMLASSGAVLNNSYKRLPSR
jgi:hypothetical protein